MKPCFFNECISLYGEAVVFMKLLWGVMTLVILGLQYRLWIDEGSYSQVWVLQQQVTHQKELNAKVEERNDHLSADVLDLKRGFDAIEERARFNLGMIGKNETFYMVVGSSM